MLQDAFCQLECRRQQIKRRHDPIDDSKVQRALRREYVPGEQQLQCALAAGKTGQPLRATESRGNTDPDLRFCEAGRFAGYRQMHSLGYFATAPEGNAVDRSDDRLREGLHARGHGLTAPNK